MEGSQQSPGEPSGAPAPLEEDVRAHIIEIARQQLPALDRRLEDDRAVLRRIGETGR